MEVKVFQKEKNVWISLECFNIFFSLNLFVTKGDINPSSIVETKSKTETYVYHSNVSVESTSPLT
jgi:hypothetical protein